jgi:hypothetical protein
MTDISKSPDRNTFQKESYLKRCADEGKDPNDDYLDMFRQITEDYDQKFTTESSRKDNMEYDLLTTDWILEKVRASEVYAQNLYAAMCNNDFIKRDIWPILKGKKWGCSWRSAGGIISDMRQEGDYIDWYCSGIREKYDGGYVPEAVVTEEIEQDLNKLGWIVVKYKEEE